MKPKLEAGQIWQARDGRKFELMRNEDETFPFTDTGKVYRWTSEGSYRRDKDLGHALDLQVLLRPALASPDAGELAEKLFLGITHLSAAIVSTIHSEEDYRQMLGWATAAGMEMPEWIASEAMKQAKANLHVWQQALRGEKEMAKEQEQ